MYDKSLKVEVDGKLISIERLVDFYKQYHWKKGDSYCPICGTDFEDAELFVCEKCGELLSLDNKSDNDERDLCIDCDPESIEAQAYWAAVESRKERDD